MPRNLSSKENPTQPPQQSSDTLPVRDVPLSEKITFLRQPEIYAEPTQGIEVRETHMSWVFLTDRQVYKLKKPVCYPFLDYSTLEQRKRMCEQEVVLNRRLAAWVYSGTVALVRDSGGRLSLWPDGIAREDTVVEWLVQMVRLSDGLMLDNAIRAGNVQAPAVERTAVHLAAFFRRATPAPLATPTLLKRFSEAVTVNADFIIASGIPERKIAGIRRTLLSFLDARATVLADRVENGRIIEGHGDLRPEHVFLGYPPAVIDCIEFSPELRQIDPLEELAFLWMECIRLRGGQWGERFLQIYLKDCEDNAPDELLWFYMSLRAWLRVRLTLGHLKDSSEQKPWFQKADEYLDLADRFSARL
jgi:aminoglycoside phosphotransferase family enzyme